MAPFTIDNELKYNPQKTYTNFWKSLMKSFNIYDLSEEDMKMDYVGPLSQGARSEKMASFESLATMSTCLGPSTACLSLKTNGRQVFKNTILKTFNLKKII